jgi:tetratricopeptide (TPR) repeat protein
MRSGDPAIGRVAFLFRGQAYSEAAVALDALEPPQSAAERAERRRIRGWLALALGETERAYDLFWSCADQAGGRAGILVLTVLAGQVSVAMTHWQRFCQTLSSPLMELPDAEWHARPVALAAIAQLQRYPFPARAPARGAAALYCALLYRALGDAPNAFIELSKVTDYYAPADLVRDRWLEEVVCLPPPSTPSPESFGRTCTAPQRTAQGPAGGAELAVQTAARLLLYPDPEILQRQCQEALERSNWLDALEILRRLLTLDPNHTAGLETRWRLHMQLGWTDAAKADLFALVEIYESSSEIRACQQAAARMVELFPGDERALLKMCFLQARLGCPLAVARYGRQLLAVCQELGLRDRFATYRLWLLRQDLALDDRSDFEREKPR